MDNMKRDIERNYRQIKSDIVHIINRETERINNDPELQHLHEKKEYFLLYPTR